MPPSLIWTSLKRLVNFVKRGKKLTKTTRTFETLGAVPQQDGTEKHRSSLSTTTVAFGRKTLLRETETHMATIEAKLEETRMRKDAVCCFGLTRCENPGFFAQIERKTLSVLDVHSQIEYKLRVLFPAIVLRFVYMTSFCVCSCQTRDLASSIMVCTFAPSPLYIGSRRCQYF